MVAFSLLVICISGVHAETVEETSEVVCQDGVENGQGMNGEMNTNGLGTWDNPNDWTPGTPLGLGTWDNPNGWEVEDDTE